MASRELYHAWKRIRANHPGITAISALSWARGEPKTAARLVALHVPRYLNYGEKSGFDLPNGARIEYELAPDECAEFSDMLGVKVEWIRYPDECPMASGSGWIARDGRAFFRGGRRNDCAWIASGYPLADRIEHNRKRGMSRHDAWIAARESLAREFANIREYWEDRETWYVCTVTLRDAAGRELYSDILGGVESSEDYWRECLADMADGILSQYLADCGRSIDSARRGIRATRAHARRLARELRALRGIVAPESCAVLREKLAAMRASVAAAARELRESKQTVAALWGIR